MILLLSLLNIVSEQTGEIVPLQVEKTYALDGELARPRIVSQYRPPPDANDRVDSHIPEAAMITPPDTHPDAQGERGREVMIADDEMDFRSWVEDSIDSQKKDIDRISDIVFRIEKDMRLCKNFMAEMRRETTAKSASSERVSRDIDSLHHGLEDLRRETRDAASARPVEGNGIHFTVEDLDSLTENISSIRVKANEVDSLKLELQIVKTRLKRLEDQTRGGSAIPPSSATPVREIAPSRAMPPPPFPTAARSGLSETRAASERRELNNSMYDSNLPKKRRDPPWVDNVAEPVSASRKKSRQSPRVTSAPPKITAIKPLPADMLSSTLFNMDDDEDELDDEDDLDQDDDDYRPSPRGRTKSVSNPTSASKKSVPAKVISRRQSISDTNSSAPPDDQETEAQTHDWLGNNSHKPPTTGSSIRSMSSASSRDGAQPRVPKKMPPQRYDENGVPITRHGTPDKRYGADKSIETVRFNEHGVRITKDGKPDKRFNTYKRRSLLSVTPTPGLDDTERASSSNFGDEGLKEHKKESGRAPTAPMMGFGNSNQGEASVLPSIENTATEEDGKERDEQRKKEAEARDRLVKETLEREMKED